MSQTVADVLASLLEEKTRAFDELQESWDAEHEYHKWLWTRHVELPKDQSLPTPRLELWFDLQNSDSHNKIIVYRMVYAHFLGHCVAVPLGCTKVSGGPVGMRLIDEIPLRDGAHIMHDAVSFGWPAYMIRGDESVRIYPSGKG